MTDPLNRSDTIPMPENTAPLRGIASDPSAAEVRKAQGCEFLIGENEKIDFPKTGRKPAPQVSGRTPHYCAGEAIDTETCSQ
jgi:hypothetical protein